MTRYWPDNPYMPGRQLFLDYENNVYANFMYVFDIKHNTRSRESCCIAH